MGHLKIVGNFKRTALIFYFSSLPPLAYHYEKKRDGKLERREKVQDIEAKFMLLSVKAHGNGSIIVLQHFSTYHTGSMIP